MNDSWQGLALKDQIGQTILKQNFKKYIKEEKNQKPKEREHVIKETVDKRQFLAFWED